MTTRKIITKLIWYLQNKYYICIYKLKNKYYETLRLPKRLQKLDKRTDAKALDFLETQGLDDCHYQDSGMMEHIAENMERYADQQLILSGVSNCTQCNTEINYKGVCEMCYTELKLNDID